MGLALRCIDFCGKCDFVIRAETEEEIFPKLVAHVRSTHGLNGVSKILKEEFRKFIRVEDPV